MRNEDYKDRIVNRVNHKKIVKNTLFLYGEIAIATIIGLFFSRIVLQTLGASDYGLYGVVGGVISMFCFISGSLSTSTSRFLNYEMGKVGGNINRIFNISIMLHLIVAIILFILLESIGQFYIHNYLNVEVDKESDAMFVFQVSTISACIGVAFVPYKALFVAHERFGTIAIIDIVNTVLKLVIALLLLLYHGNSLRFYAILMSTTAVCICFTYYYYAAKKWPKEISWKWERKIESYKEQFSFNNWNLLSTAAVIGRQQGTHILINLFFGTLINGAYSISIILQNYSSLLAEKFSRASMPQITQLIGNEDANGAILLSSRVSRIHLLLMEIVFFPIWIELEFLLRLWLGDALPPDTLMFCRCTLLVALVGSTASGLGALINGFGKVKWFKIQLSFWFLLCIPGGYVMYSYGYPAYYIVLLFAIADVMNRICQLLLLKKLFCFQILDFIIKAWLRPMIVAAILTCLLFTYDFVRTDNDFVKMLGVLGMGILSITTAFVVGLRKKEIDRVVNYIIRKFTER